MLRRLLSVVPSWVTVAALLSTATPPVAKLIIAAVLAVTLWSPAEGLLLAAGLAPLGALLAVIFEIDPFRLTEAIIVSFLAGWLVRPWPVVVNGPKLPRYAIAAGWLFAVMVVASIVGMGWQLSRYPGQLRQTLVALSGAYYLGGDGIGVTEGAKLLEGFAMVVAAVVLFRRRPALAVELPAVLAAVAVCAALSSALLWRGVGPDRVLAQYARTGYRVAAHVADVNAAGSYFVLILCLSLGMSAREYGTRRAWWAGAAIACLVGVWLCASRTALAAAGIAIPVTVAWAATLTWRPAARAAALGTLMVGLLAIGGIRARMLERDPTYTGSGLRTEFNETSLRMVAARPLFGVGVGQYYPDALLFLGPQLAWKYGHENAHNNFLQIASESGLVGFGLFTLWMAGGITAAARALARRPDDWRLLGALAGVVAFLGTCLTGHPLLVTEVAFAFWLQLGLVAALGSSTLLNLDAGTARASERTPSRTRSALRAAALVVGVLALGSLAVSALRDPLAPPSSRAVDGFYGWETGADGVRFRWSEQYMSLFVPGDVARVDIPVRAPKEERGRTPMGVELSLDGVGRGRFLADDRWTTISIDLSRPTPPIGMNRINLRVNRTWRPALLIPGSADMRVVGVQVGEYRVLRAGAAVTGIDR